MNSTKFQRLAAAWFVVGSLLGSSAWAADTDLFAFSPSGSSTGAANVLIVMDNAASFSANASSSRCGIDNSGNIYTSGTITSPTNLDGKGGGVEQCALFGVLKSLTATASATLNIGFMVFNANPMVVYKPDTNTFGATDCKVGSAWIGGCLVSPITAFTPTVQTNLMNWVKSWTVSGSGNYNIKANGISTGAIMQEAWAYYTGKTGVSGRDYASLKPTTGCGNNYVIYIGNAFTNAASPGDGQAEGSASPFMALSGTTSVLGKRAFPAATTSEKTIIAQTLTTLCGTSSLPSTETQGAYGLNWARYMKNQHGFKTYSIGVLSNSCKATYGAYLKKLGSDDVGGGKYFETTNYSEIVSALSSTLGEIIAVNSVFTAVSLPVSVNQQDSYSNQVFVGMFRPDGDFFPRWHGNLKQYKIGYTDSTKTAVRLEDAAGTNAVNSNTGFITECARSFWTPSSVDTYWQNASNGVCSSVSGSADSNYPDGNVVEKGGHAYQLRALAPSSRTVKTCLAGVGACTSLSDYTTSTLASLSASNFGVTTDGEKNELIQWSRGVNLDNELSRGTTVMRPSVHGDVVHSRPAPVNHGSLASPAVVVYYGANDGMLRAINGNQTESIVSDGKTFTPGQELWSFMPPEFFSKVSRLRSNSVNISYPNTPASASAPKDYGMDGPMSALTIAASGSSPAKSYLYSTMRRGGRAIYAFDVSTPAAPSLLWKAGCATAVLTDDSTCVSGFSAIGQTWPSLKSLYVGNYSSGADPLFAFGGGYDSCEDYDALTSTGANHNCTASSKGGVVYVVDAVTGAVVRSFATSGGRGIVGDVAIVPDAVTKKAKYGYVADLGGNVYRLDFTGADSTAWSMTRIASLGCSTAATCTANRKFMFVPSVVTLDNETFYVLLGSGDREKPVKYYQSSYAVTNYFFQIKDKPSDAAWLTSEAANCTSAVICLSSMVSITSSTPSESTLAAAKGWYLALASSEQIVTSALTAFGVTTFSSHKPADTSSDSCTTNLGATKVYNISYADASGRGTDGARSQDLAGDGLPPSPVGVNVLLGNDSGNFDRQVIIFGSSGDSSLAPELRSRATGSGGTTYPKARLYWYIQR